MSVFAFLIGALSLAAAIGVVISAKPVHSALFLMANFATLAILYVLLDAQFLAAAQVIIYAGGIVILILFVIMLIGHDPADRSQQVTWPAVASLVLGVILLASLVLQLTGRLELGGGGGIASGGSPSAVGTELFTRFLLPFEFVAILLLVALIGALIMGRRESGEPVEEPVG
ncbi:MAG: NADH-quinone oxidoreductase subunit J [Caldilineaceae bacterium SB0666_bin_21]|nr:NADH-quinone oxidoreductase subunit J [Caldilineaceae bacterium SB0665_bin_21]MXZ40569.1 NADH-quinone oxidoreductase subunit J [Caldilineaceae bacterium SB0666_bin_21]MYA05840.1 NADH-quinone oxidoreductase subunit J [Caldilineaceae bacterium SB0664_bin_22]MYC63743.1 NADH-quinone oxidoreductase subunit J [Caldilineaceae bacterium SB0661_bin_34]